MFLTQKQLDLLENFADQNDYEFRDEYSGRGMFGKECVAFVIEESHIKFAMKLQTMLSTSGEEALSLQMQRNCATDSMGKYGTIVYFPTVQTEGAPTGHADLKKEESFLSHPCQTF